MPIKWKAGFKPEVVIAKVLKSRKISENGKVSFTGWDSFYWMPALKSMLILPSVAVEINIEKLIWKALSTVEVLDKNTFLTTINQILTSMLKISFENYRLLTKISCKADVFRRNNYFEECKLTILKNGYPPKYRSRDKILSTFNPPNVTSDIYYSCVIVYVKSKSHDAAIYKAMRCIDLYRGIWNYFSNSSMSFGGDNWAPINKIRMGSVHTLHLSDGKSANNSYWFETNFHKAQIFNPKNKKKHLEEVSTLEKKLFRSSYSNLLCESIILSARALDEADPNIAFIKLWGALERIAIKSDENYAVLVKRISKIFTDREYAEQLLEHLRNSRNANIHSGEQREDAKYNLYTLQLFYHYSLRFHLQHYRKFKTIDDAFGVLDLPTDEVKLKTEERRLKYARDYFNKVLKEKV